MDFTELAWSLEKFFKKLSIFLSNEPRPSSEPFITGDGFRKLAKHKYESGNQMLQVGLVALGDIIFVENDLLVSFFDRVHPQISNPYILISHNGEVDIDESLARRIDNKVLHWFARNLIIEHPRITPIPAGIENLSLADKGMLRLYQEHSSDIAEIRQGEVEAIRDMRKSRILYSFNADTNPVARGEALSVLSKCDTADKLNRGDFVSQPVYTEMLRSYMYVISPIGRGEDCFRTWEALYTGTIPVMLDSIMVRQFKKFGVPILSIPNWKTLETMSKYELIAEYDVLWKAANIDALYFDFWKNMICEKQREAISLR